VKYHAILPILATLLACPAWAADQDVDARAALALAAARPAQAPKPPQAPTLKGGCPCGNGCPCGGACGCADGQCSGDCWPGCETVVSTRLTYSAARHKAVAEDRPVCVWVGGFVCPPCIKETPGALHVFVDELGGDDSPRCVVGRPDGRGDLDRVAVLTGAMTPGRLTAALLSKPAASARPAPGVGPFPAGPNGFAAPPAFFGQGGCGPGGCGGASFGGPPMMGGFGGGFSGGGCASCGGGGGGRRR
jgi:hypothetical protein